MIVKKRISLLVAALMFLQLFLLAVPGFAASKITWGKTQTATYDKLQDTILMYKNELYAGGYVLSKQTTTTKKSEADFVMNTYGDLGAAGVIELNEKLEDPTNLTSAGTLGTSVRMKIEGVYLISLNDASFAKIRIDRMTSAKVIFSYVLEAPAESAPKPQPSQDTKAPAEEKTVTLEEGNVGIKWDATQGEVSWDIYRSDNGSSFVRLNDFQLSTSLYMDNYAIVDHVYFYKYVSFDINGKKLNESPPVKVIIVKKETLNPPAPPEAKQTKIIMQLDNKNASVNGKPYILEVAPILLSGTTMVPVRFVSEALGAKVQWSQDEYKILITLGNDTVILWIDQVKAQVNGKAIFMTVPATIRDGNTFVPVRFVSENLKQNVVFMNETRQIIITGQNKDGYSGTNTPSEPASPSNPNVPKEPTQPKKPQADYSSLFHIWQLDIPGVSYQTLDKIVTSVGALSGGLLISSDGTYIWNSTWDGRLIEGEWRESGNPSYPILLVNAQENKNWLVGKTNGGKDIYVWDENSIYYIGYAVD